MGSSVALNTVSVVAGSVLVGSWVVLETVSLVAGSVLVGSRTELDPMSLVELDVCATSEVLGTSVDDRTSLVGPSVEVGLFADRVLVGESVLTGSELMTSVVGEPVGS